MLRQIVYLLVLLAIFVVCFAFGLTCAAAATLDTAPAILQCEGLANPEGIDTAQPRLSWELPWAGRGRRQSAYQIIVSSRPNRPGDLWETGKVSSELSTGVVYSGQPMPAGQRCFWQVRAWDESGQPSPWSKPARWSMGLLAPSDWHGRWIGSDNTGRDSMAAQLGKASWIWYPEGNPSQVAPLGTRYFRRQITIPITRTIREATCTLSADDAAV